MPLLAHNDWLRLRYTIQAPLYDLGAAAHRESRRRAIARLRLAPGERVLVVGAGTGADLPLLPADVRIVAVDLTPSMLERAREHAQANVELRVMDAHSLDLPDASFDAVLLHQVLQVVGDPVRCLAEACRVLRPGGRVSIFDKFPRAPLDGIERLAARAVDLVFTTPKHSAEPLLGSAADELEAICEEPGPGRFRIVVLRRRAAVIPSGPSPDHASRHELQS